jgi:small subunit ribosomal protein S6
MAQPEARPSSLAREYESIYVLRPDVARESADKISMRLQEVIQREGGTLTLVENWGRRQLVSELERNLRMLDDVIKYQSVKLRDDVDVASVVVDPELVKFEPVQPPDESEPEESYARSLGLEEMTRDSGPGDQGRGDDDDFSESASDEGKPGGEARAAAQAAAGADSAEEQADSEGGAQEDES